MRISWFSLLNFRLRHRLRRDLAEALRAKAGVFTFDTAGDEPRTPNCEPPNLEPNLNTNRALEN